MRQLVPGLLVTLSLALAGDARAAKPTARECIASADSSLKLRADHKLRAAREAVLLCSARSCPKDVREECARRVEDLNSAIPSVVFSVTTPAGDEVTAVKVTMDGESVAEHLDGTAIPLDPGSHELTFEAEGQPSLTKTLVLHEGEKNRPEAVVVGAPPPPVVAAVEPPPEPSPSDAHPGENQRLAGLVVGGAGAAGVVIGAIFGGLTFSTWSTAKGECPTGAGCSTAALNERGSAVTDGAISTVGFIAGAILAGGGAALYFTAPKGGAAAVHVGVTAGGLRLSGTF